MTHNTHALLITVLLLLPAGGLAAAQDPSAQVVRPPTTSTSEQAVRTTYRLGPDDQILIQVADVPEISAKPQRLDPNGELKLPMIGRVQAAGMTLQQLESELTTRLKMFIREPDVAITVTEFHSQSVSVIGAVGTAGVRQLEGQKTLIEMLSLTGGVRPDAGPWVRVTRQLDEGRIPLAEAADDVSGRFSSVEVDLKALLDGRTPEKNILIRPHDVISVPRADLVFVVGEVGRPGPIPLGAGNSVSVMEAVSTSGGALRTAATSAARILRRVEGTQTRKEVEIDLKRIMQGKANDLPLMAGDILVIPDSKGKRAVARVLEAAVQAGVMLGSYGFIR